MVLFTIVTMLCAIFLELINLLTRSLNPLINISSILWTLASIILLSVSKRVAFFHPIYK